MTDRRVVFVADDLGVSSGTNAGIAAAARGGLVRSASLCVTGEAVEEGVALARELGLDVGLHLSLTLGRALSGPVRGLTDGAGRFLGLGRALLGTHLRVVDRAALEREIGAQFDRLCELGVEPAHADGHHHVHCLPVVRDLFAAACRERGVRWTRLPRELSGLAGGMQPTVLVLRRLAAGAERPFGAAGLRWLPFLGATLEGRLDHGDRFEAALARLPAGDSEWMVHPREPDAAFADLDPRGARRDAAARAELATLTSPTTIALLATLGVHPIPHPRP